MKSLSVVDFGLGLMTKLSPTQVPPGAALVSFDCDYNTRNVQNRRGYDRILENGPGAIQIANFEPAENWGGAPADTTNFVGVEAAAPGTQGRVLNVAGPGTASIVLTPVGSLNLGTDPQDVIHLWLNPTRLDATVGSYSVVLKFLDTNSNFYFQATLAADTGAPDILEVGFPKYHRVRRAAFTKVGSPDWTNIAGIVISGTVAGAGNLSVTCDNLHRTPGLMQDLFQFRRQSGPYAGAADFYAVANGNIYKSDGLRWNSIFSGLDAKAPVYSLSALDRRIVSDGVTSPQVIQPDGSTVYRLGIVTPPKQMTATQIGGGGLPDGSYFAQVLWYSSKTGTFSAPDDRTPRAPIIAIVGGGGNAGIQFANIPVSSDPQVDWVVIGIRPDTEPTLFFRASDGLFGEVANGTTSFTYQESYANLLARSLTAVDPDLDYPSVVNAATGQPVEAHPVFLAQAGGYIIAVMAEEPTVVRVSRFQQPGSWALDDEFPLGQDDQESITGIVVNASNVVVMKRDAVFPGRVIGEPDKLTFSEPLSDRGAVSHKAMQVIGHVLFYRALDGIYRLDQTLIPTKITDLQQPTWRDTWDTSGFASGVMVPIRDSEQVVLFGRKLGSTFNDQGWVTHYRTVAIVDEAPSRWPTWAPSLWRMPADVGTEVLRAPNEGGTWETWIGANGQVFRVNYGVQDDGRAIEMIHKTGLLTDDARTSKLWRFLDLEAFCSGAVTVEAQVFLGTAIATDSTLSAGLQGNAAVLGSFILGTSLLGSPKYVMPRLRMPRTPARYFSVQLRAKCRQHVEVYRMSAWWNPLGMRRAA